MKTYYKVQLFAAIGFGDVDPKWHTTYTFDTLQECKDYYNTCNSDVKSRLRVIEITEKALEMDS